MMDEIVTTMTRIHDRQLHDSGFIIQNLRYQSQILDNLQATQRVPLQHMKEHFAAQAKLLEGIAIRATENRNPLQIKANHTQQTRLIENSLSNTSRLIPNEFTDTLRATTQDGLPIADEQNVPLLIMTLTYPSMPTWLHVFEDPYRLVLQRVSESGNRTFGMTMYNDQSSPQGDLGETEFMQYGTLLKVVASELLPDGRRLIETVGVSRFRIKSYGRLDGYYVADIESVNDVSLAEEKDMEAKEAEMKPPAGDVLAALNTPSTQELLQIGFDFVIKMQGRSVPWLRQQVIKSYGLPPNNPSVFPYWLASVSPIRELEKYRLISATGVRQRLKICANWVRVLEGQKW